MVQIKIHIHFKRQFNILKLATIKMNKIIELSLFQKKKEQHQQEIDQQKNKENQ